MWLVLDATYLFFLVAGSHPEGKALRLGSILEERARVLCWKPCSLGVWLCPVPFPFTLELFLCSSRYPQLHVSLCSPGCPGTYYEDSKSNSQKSSCLYILGTRIKSVCQAKNSHLDPQPKA